MKKFLKYFVCINFALILFFTSTKVFAMTVSTQESDKLLGNFIESAFNIFYGRESTMKEFSSWYNKLSKGQITVEEFVKSIVQSKEFKENVQLKTDFVYRLYKFLLDREADEEGMTYWTNYIKDRILFYYKDEYSQEYLKNDILNLRWNINESPKMVDEIVEKIISSPEFLSRVSQMNIKFKQSDIISKNRIGASKIYAERKINIEIFDNSQEILEAQNKAKSTLLNLKMEDENIKSVLKSKVLKYLDENVLDIENIAVSFYDVNTGESFDINGDVLFKAGSTYKVPMNLILYDLVQAGKVDLNELVEYNHEKHYEGGSGILQKSLEDEHIDSQRLEDLSRLSIVNSDNIAANMLMTGIRKYANIYREYGNMLGYQITHTGNLFTSNEMNKFLKKLYFNEKDNPYYNVLIGYMKASSSGVRIGRYIPDDIVASKYGSYQGYYNDIAIVDGKNPFILSILTKDLPNAETIISNVAKIIYQR